MESGACNALSCVDMLEVCGWTMWASWDTCTTTCGGGQQQRLRQKRWLPISKKGTNQSDSKAAGPALSGSWRRLILDEHALQLSNVSFSEGTQRRLADAPLVLGNPNGCVGSQKEIRPCGLAPCDGMPAPVACAWEPWSDWGSCACEGLEEHNRGILSQAKNGGVPCVGPARTTRRCQPHCERVSVDCNFGVWSMWSDCSASCGGGQKYHTRTLQRHAEVYGAGCKGPLEETSACNTQICFAPQDCQYDDWSEWSACSRSCGGGERSRARSIQHYAEHGGQKCVKADLMSLAACGQESCQPWAPIDCQWSIWTPWSQCSTSCGPGRQFRSHQVATQATHGGMPCSGYYEEYKDCQQAKCTNANTDCIFTDWSEWSSCFDKCSGHQERSRTIAVFASTGGNPCQGSTRHVVPCQPSRPGVAAACAIADGSANCTLGQWSGWSDCSRTCGGGQQFTQRQVTQQARGLGTPCQASLKKTESCSASPCPGDAPVDCRWGAWEGFSDCTATCGGGQTHRHRSITVEARNSGRECVEGDTLEVRPCNMQLCGEHTYCVWSSWSPWRKCSATCGGGQKKRHRLLVTSSTPPRDPLPGRIGAFNELPSLTSRFSLHLFVQRYASQLVLLSGVGSASLLLTLGWFVWHLGGSLARRQAFQDARRDYRPLPFVDLADASTPDAHEIAAFA